MRQNQFIAQVANELWESKARTADIIKTIFGSIQDAMAAQDKVVLSGFGTFSTREVKERNGHNPQTGEKLIVPAHVKVKFVPSRATKEALNK